MRCFLKQTKTKKGLYLQIYESRYLPAIKGSRNRCRESLGYVEDLRKKGIKDPITHYQNVVRRINDELAVLEEKSIGDVSSLKNVGHFLLQAVGEMLDLKNDLRCLLANRHFQYDCHQFIPDMIAAQVIMPTSKFRDCHDGKH